jgi:hypothetical protein
MPLDTKVILNANVHHREFRSAEKNAAGTALKT